MASLASCLGLRSLFLPSKARFRQPSYPSRIYMDSRDLNSDLDAYIGKYFNTLLTGT